MRYLAEAGLLERVTAVSSVSGGSILAAWLAARWPLLPARDGDPVAAFERDVSRPFCELIGSRNLRNRWLGLWLAGRLAGRRTSRSAAFAHALSATGLVGRGPLRDLEPALQVVFTSTDLGSGEPFRLAAEFLGTASYGYREPPPTLPLATAVAASAAEPSYFSPLHLRAAELGLGGGEDALSLVDGGVFDNLGTEWFEDWDDAPRPAAARRPDFLVVVDAAGPFSPTRHPIGFARAFLRAPAIADAHMRAERVVSTREKFERGELHGVLPPLLRGRELWELLARLRTDLDRFTPLERALLQLAGYWGLHEQLRLRRPVLALDRPAWRPETPDRDLRTALERGSRRVLARRA